MKLDFCAACGKQRNLQHHHLITRQEGGSDDETNLITLCGWCHDRIHVRRRNGRYDHSEAVRIGHAKAKAKGVQFGRKPKLTAHQRREATARREAGETLTSIARSFNVSHTLISRLVAS